MTGALAGRRIVVTRPRELAQGLADLLREAGAEALLYPAIDIRPPENPAPARALLARLTDFDLAVFVSPSAVRMAFALLPELRLPPGLRLAAVGEGTRRALEAQGATEVIVPTRGADSEALLALPVMTGLRRVAILRGAGGREVLAEALAARGTRVEAVECYRRARPEGAAPPAGKIDAWCATSGEALQNLAALLGRERLAQAPIFLPHERVVRLARGLGLGQAVLAGPGDADMLASLVAYFSAAK